MNNEDKVYNDEKMLRFERVAVLAREIYIAHASISPEDCFCEAESFFEEYDKRRKEIDG